MSRTLRAVVLAALILLLIALGATLGYFLIQNGSWVVVRFPTVQLDWEAPLGSVEYEAPLALVMAISAAVGFVLAMLLFLPSWIRRAWERRRERRFIASLEGELTDLRNLPVDHPAPLEDLADEDRPARRKEAEQKERGDEDAALLAAALREVDEEPGR